MKKKNNKISILFADNYVSVRGTVVRVSSVRPLIRQLDFECARCGEIKTVELVDGKYSSPHKCKGCKSAAMVAKRTEADSVDWQKIRCAEKKKIARQN